MIDQRKAIELAEDVCWFARMVNINLQDAGLAQCVEKARALLDDAAKDRPYHASELPKAGETYRHNNGSLYRVDLVANVDSDRPGYPVTVCYRGEDGRAWSKTLGEFLAKMTRVESGTETALDLEPRGGRKWKRFVIDDREGK